MTSGVSVEGKRRSLLLAAAIVVILLIVTSTYYFVLLPGASATTVTIVATGGQQYGAFTPANFTAKEGQRVALVFVNSGSAPHELQIPALSVSTGIVNAGATMRVSFTPNKVGTFGFDQPPSAGPVPMGIGMVGNVTVLPP